MLNSYPVIIAFKKVIWLSSDLTNIEEDRLHGRVEVAANEDSSCAILRTVFLAGTTPIGSCGLNWKLT